MSEALQEWKVTPSQSGQRLDRFLGERLGVSRREVRELLRLGAVLVNGRPVAESDKGRTLRPGETVASESVDDRLHRPTPRPDLACPVVAEGPGWVALDKPAGTGVHPLRADQDDTMLNALVARHPEIQGVGEGGLRSGVVHRLDVDTSGVQLFATEPASWERVRAAFREHRIDKVYRALVEGRPEEHGEAQLQLAVTRHRPARVSVLAEATPDSRVCSLRWRRLEVYPRSSLIELRPRTGFLHQVRVTMAHLGHPLLGDATYGSGAGSGAERHMLHALSLDFEEIHATASEPADFLECQRLRAAESG